MIRLAAILLVLLLAGAPVSAQTKGEPGRFDYFVLSLSWSPTWCGGRSGQQDFEQCGGLRRYGFVVHGLWPQYAKGGYPATCAAPSPLPPPLVHDMLPIMPSRKLIEHEWAKHGTCAGGDAAAYFGATRAAWQKVKIPAPLVDPGRPRVLPVAEVKQLFVAANPGLPADGITITCRSHRVSQVRVCLDRALNFRPCGRDLRDGCGAEAQFPAAR